jgi:hypothetical protein
MPSIEGVDDDAPPKGYGVRGRSTGIDGTGVFGRGGEDGVLGLGF